jgi:hypothetical protein
LGVEMTFKFAVSPNAWNIRIGNIFVPFKYGWDYPKFDSPASLGGNLKKFLLAHFVAIHPF